MPLPSRSGWAKADEARQPTRARAKSLMETMMEKKKGSECSGWVGCGWFRGCGGFGVGGRWGWMGVLLGG